MPSAGITQDRQATMAQSQAMMNEAQTINQILSKIEAITHTVEQSTKQVSAMLWENLQQADLIIPRVAQETDPATHNSGLSMDIMNNPVANG